MKTEINCHYAQKQKQTKNTSKTELFYENRSDTKLLIQNLGKIQIRIYLFTPKTKIIYNGT